jgi:predicted nuclease of predicted toxin-antitoxin system
MKLLVDANISWRLMDLIEDYFPESIHLSSTDLIAPAKDIEIWNFAFKKEYIIVTNDEDFYDLTISKGFPPKIILLRTGNLKTKYLSKVLIDHKSEIELFSSSADIGILEIY